MRLTNIGTGLLLCATLLGRFAQAQQTDPWDFRAPGITREQLEGVLARYEAAAQSPAYSEGMRARARADADSVRARLVGGDLRVGDRMRISVDGQPQLADTAAVVTEGPALVMAGIGTVPLGGVLRSEVGAQVSRSVDRVYLGAVARVRLLTRVAVVGGVVRSGFHTLPSGALVEDAITVAGGPSPDAVLTEIYVERGRERLWEPDSLQVAMRGRRTLGELGIQDGDRIVVPTRVRRDSETTIRTVSYLLSLPLSLYTLVQLLKR